MASKPAGRKSGNRYPACIGNLLQLFDFNQALTAMKLLTNKKLAGRGSKEATRASSTSDEEDIPFGYEVFNVPSVKKPIKSSSGQIDVQAKDHLPTVVARLVGFDALSDDQKPCKKPSTQSKGGRQERSVSERQHHVKAYDGSNHGTKPKASTMSLYSQEQDVDYRPAFFRDYPQEQQLQEFEEELATWQDQKLMNQQKKSLTQYNHLGTHAATNKTEKYTDVHSLMPLRCEGFSSSRATQVSLQESKEFLDEVDFLHSNKQLLKKFLQEPNSLFAKDKKDDVGNTVKHRPSHEAPSATRGSRRIFKHNHLPQINDHSTINSLLEFAESFKTQARCEPILPHADAHKLTRIVVLKPNPAREANGKSLGHLGSTRHNKTESMCEDNVGALARLKEQLRKYHSSNHGNNTREVQESFSKNWRRKFKDPREIARVIARQVRENVSRELWIQASNDHCGEMNFCWSTTQYNNQSSEEDVNRWSSHREVSQMSRNHKCHILNNANGGSKSPRMDLGKNAKRCLRMASTEGPNEFSFMTPSYTKFRKEVLSTDSCHTLRSEHKSLPTFTSKKHIECTNKHNQEEIFVKESRDFHSRSSSLDFGIGPLVEVMGEKSPLMLPRSRSVPSDSAFLDCSREGLQVIKDAKPDLNIKVGSRKSNDKIDSSCREAALGHASIDDEEAEAQEMEGNFDGTCSEYGESSMLVSNESRMLERESGHDQDHDASVALQDEDKLQKDSPVRPLQASCSIKSDFLDSTVDVKLEQPSPVSVLELPYHEDVGDNHENLRLSDDKELGLELYPSQEDCDVWRSSSVCKEPIDKFEKWAACRLNFPNYVLNLEEFCCPSGKEAEMLYVGDVLVACGIVAMGNTSSPNELYPPKLPLDNGILQKMESNTICKERQVIDAKHGYKGNLSYSMRHLLFDRVNEILCEAVAASQWFPFHNSRLLTPLYGGELLKHVWLEVCHLSCVQSRAQISLDSLVSGDLCDEKKDQWLRRGLESSAIMIDVEGAIFDDLVDETLLVFL